MPLFSSSRRKSEANLRASASPEQPPLPHSSSTSTANLASALRGQQQALRGSRSRSASRTGEKRPERERQAHPQPPMPSKTMIGGGRRSTGGSSGEGWVVLDGTAAPPSLPSKQDVGGGGPLTPIAARYSSSSSSSAPRGFDNPSKSRREGSFASPSSGFHPSTLPNLSSADYYATSADFFAAPSSTNEGNRGGFALDGGVAAASSSGQRQEQVVRDGYDNVHASPSSSFIVRGSQVSPSKGFEPAYESAQATAGLPPSTSFYNFNNYANGSPQKMTQRESFQPRNGNGSLEESPTKAGGRRAENASDGSWMGEAKRANLQAMSSSSAFSSPPQPLRQLSHSSSPTHPPVPAPSRSLGNLSNSSTTPSYLPNSLSSSASSSSPPPRAADNSLAAFFGTPALPKSSPGLSGSSSYGSPNLENSLSSEEGGSTEATSTEGEDEEGSTPVKPALEQQQQQQQQQRLTKISGGLQPSLLLRSPVKQDEEPSVRNSPTPTRTTFPARSSQTIEQALPTTAVREAPPLSLQRVEKPATRHPSVDHTSAPPSLPSPVRWTRQPSLPPTSPVDVGNRQRNGSTSTVSRPSLDKPTSTSPRKLVKQRSSIDVKERSAIPRPAGAHRSQPSVERRKAPVDVSTPLAEAQQTATPPRSRAASLITGDVSSRASSRTAKPLPPPLQPSFAAPPRPITPPAAPLSATPRTPRRPLTPKSARPVPPPLDLGSSKATSPSRKRLTAEGTTRASALAAARDREKKVAQAALEPEAGDGRDEQQEREEVQEEEEEVPSPLRPRFEFAFATYTTAILHSLLHHIGFNEVVALRQVSKSLRQAIDGDGKEVILERFLGAQGYRSYASSPTLNGTTSSRRFLPPPDSITVDLRDLLAFRAGLPLSPDDYSLLARSYLSSPSQFSPTSLKLARATTRAWNRVVLRLRSQSLLPAKAFNPPAFPDLAPTSTPVYKTGRAASLRVWVPTAVSNENWMSDKEVVECEREVYRSSGAWPQLRKGDVVTNVAIEAFGNVGKLLFDGRFLRDLSFTFDITGHLPPWLNALNYSVSHFHNIVVSSSSNPVFYLSLAPFVQSVRETIQLCNDRVPLSSPQGNYMVKKFVYRAGIKIKPGQMIGAEGGGGGSGPGGIDVVQEDWAGHLVLETEGTTEQATMLIARAASVDPTPWRIIRAKCRPGKLWLVPVLDSEAC